MKLLLLFLLPACVFGQQVIFCEQVDSFGNPKNASTEFSIGDKGGFFKVLVKRKHKVGAKTAVFDIYKVNGDERILNNSIRMDLNPALTWFYKEILFFETGTYEVYVYDERDKLLGVGQVLIKRK